MEIPSDAAVVGDKLVISPSGLRPWPSAHSLTKRHSCGAAGRSHCTVSTTPSARVGQGPLPLPVNRSFIYLAAFDRCLDSLRPAGPHLPPRWMHDLWCKAAACQGLLLRLRLPGEIGNEANSYMALVCARTTVADQLKRTA